MKRKKKLWGILIFALCLIAVSPRNEAAAAPYGWVQFNDSFYWTKTGSLGFQMVQIMGEGKMPDEGEGFCEQWKQEVTGAFQVILVGRITEIGNRSFAEMESLQYVSFLPSVVKIGQKAFMGCGKIRNMYLPTGLNSIGDGAFKNCRSLEKIAIPAGVSVIGEEVFSGCSSLAEFYVPGNVVSIKSKAFEGCSALKSIVISSGLTEISDDAFDGCSAEKLIFYVRSGSKAEVFAKEHGYRVQIIPEDLIFCGNQGEYFLKLDAEGTLTVSPADMEKESILTIPSVVFEIKRVVIEEGITSIDSSFFNSCVEMTEVSFPKGITAIGEYAFTGCSSLGTVELPDSVREIGTFAFSYCSSLKSVNIPGSIERIEEYAFFDCTSLTSVTIQEGVKRIRGSAFSCCTSLKQIDLPEGIQQIEGGAFAGCTSLAKVNLPDSLLKIGNGAFSACPKLSAITIPEKVEQIDGNAFQSCLLLKTITIPERVKTIGEYLFNNCTELETVVLQQGLTSIGPAFFGCNNLTSVWIPESVTEIDESAFLDCDPDKLILYVNAGSYAEEYAKANNWKYKTVEKNIIACGSEGDNIFWQLDMDGTLTLSGKGKMKEYGFDWTNMVERVAPWSGLKNKIKKIVIEKGIETVGIEAFEAYGNLVEVVIADTVTEIGNGAFMDCEELVKVTLPEGIKTIEAIAFAGCHKLKEIEIPSGITKIGTTAFADCESLETVCIPKGVKTIPDNTFLRCYSLKNVTLPQGLTEIGMEAFFWCMELEELIIPESVTTIGDRAFVLCDKLTLKVYPGSYAEAYAKSQHLAYEVISGGKEPIDVTAPVNLTAAAGSNQVIVSWDAVPGAEQYALFLKRTNGEVVLIHNRVEETSYTVTGLANGTAVGFIVKAYGNGKWSDWSATAWATPKAYEAVAPANVTVTAGDGSAVVSWDAVPGAQMYAIFLKRTNGEVVLIDNRVTATTYNVPGLANGTTVGFVVKSYVGKKWSGWSTVAWATPQIPVVPPTGVTAAAGNGSVTVSWDAVPGAQTYAVFLKKTDGEVVLVHNRVSGTSYTVNGLANGTKVGFVVKAYIPKTWSTWSTVAWTTPTAGK